MASQTNGEVFGQPHETKHESPESVLPGESVQQIKELIDSVKILSAGDSFKYADGLFNEMIRLRQEAKVNEDEVGNLRSQLQQSRTNSKIAHQEFLESHQETVHKIKEEKGELWVKLDRVEKELDSQEKLNRKQSETLQELQLEITSLSSKNQSLQESISRTQNKVKELESKSTAKDSTILQLQQNLEQKEVIASNTEGRTKTLEREKTDLKNQLDDTNRKFKALMDFCYPLSSESRDEVSVIARYFNPYQAITNCPPSRNSMRGVWRSCFDVVKTNIWKELPVPEKEEVHTRSIQESSANQLSGYKSMDSIKTGAGGNTCDSDTLLKHPCCKTNAYLLGDGSPGPLTNKSHFHSDVRGRRGE
jgi:hypothetical protein